MALVGYNMMPSSGPITPFRPGGPSRVIQGYFPGGQPRIPQPAVVQATRPVAPPPRPLPVPARLAAVQPAIVPGRRVAVPAAGRPGSPANKPQPILPTAARRGPVQPFAPARPAPPAAILPPAPSTTPIQLSAGNAFALPAGFQLRPSALGQRLPESVQRKMEAFFRADFSDVRVHVGQEASSIGALAFAHGTDLYFAPGQYNPQTPQGQRLLGHELTHVVQQRAGRVRNPLGSGVAVVQDPMLETEAERMGMQAASSILQVQARLAASSPVNPRRQLGTSASGHAPRVAVLPCRPNQPHGGIDRSTQRAPSLTGIGDRSILPKRPPGPHSTIQLLPNVLVEVLPGTNLREARHPHSLRDATVFREIPTPERLTIDKGEMIESGLHKSGHHSASAQNDWYRVVSDSSGSLKARSIWVPAGMLKPATRSTPARASSRLDWMACQLTDGNLYGVIPGDSSRLYGRRDAPHPEPRGLYRKEMTVDTFGRPVQVWTPNVRLIHDRELSPSGAEGAAGAGEARKFSTLRTRIKTLQKEIDGAVNRKGRGGPSMGLVGINDCDTWAGVLRMLITDALAVEGKGSSINYNLTEDEDERCRDPGNMEVGYTMLQILGKKARSRHHAATVVARDGVSVVTLEAHVEKLGLTAPEFHIYAGVKGFCFVNNEGVKYLKDNQERGTVYRPGKDWIYDGRSEELRKLQKDVSKAKDLQSLQKMMTRFMEFTAPGGKVPGSAVGSVRTPARVGSSPLATAPPSASPPPRPPGSPPTLVPPPTSGGALGGRTRFQGNTELRCYVDPDTSDQYDSLGSWRDERRGGRYYLLRRRRDHFLLKIDDVTKEVLDEDDHSRRVRLNQVRFDPALSRIIDPLS